MWVVDESDGDGKSNWPIVGDRKQDLFHTYGRSSSEAPSMECNTYWRSILARELRGGNERVCGTSCVARLLDDFNLRE